MDNTRRALKDLNVELAIAQKKQKSFTSMIENLKAEKERLEDESDRERVMEYLRNAKFVDDERYARAFVNDKIRYNKWGRRKVEQGLWAKHIDGDIRQRVLDEVDDSEYMSVLIDLLKAKRRGIKADTDYEVNMKLVKYAMSRGFDYHIIRR